MVAAASSWLNRWTKHLRLDPEIWGLTVLTIVPIGWFINYSWRQSVVKPDLEASYGPTALQPMAQEVGQQVMDAKGQVVGKKVRIGKVEDPLVERAQVIEGRGAHQNVRR